MPAGAARTHAPTEDQQLDAYARARMAEADGALIRAADAYRDALALDPGNGEVASRAYRQAVLAGDKALALRAARSLDAANALPRDAVVLLLIDALDHGKWAEARAAIDRLEREENFAFIVPFMKSWVSLRDGPYDPPVVPVEKPYAVFAVRYLEEQLLLQRLAAGDAQGAADAYVQARRRGTAFGPEQRGRYAARFAALGRRDVALDLLATGAGGTGGAEDALKRAEKQYRKTRFTPQAGLALLMHRLALDLLGQGEGTATLSIARTASFAEPDNQDIRVVVARAALSADAPEIARTVAEETPPGSFAWFDAQATGLRALLEQGRDAEAVAQARQMAQAGTDPRAWRLFGDMLSETDDFAGAADAYARARDLNGDREDPALLLQLGGALERSGRWAEAKPMLERVVALAPDSAAALNHLGFAMAERGEDLPRAISLLERANRLRPKEPAFVDSLGWALFRAGQPEKALPLIQSAVAADPGQPELSEHLGDILWAMGRRFEARYAWEAALTVMGEDTPMLRARIARKLAEAGVFSATP